MPLRVAMPVSVMKPISVATESGWLRDPERRDGADQRERHVAHDDGRQHGRAIALNRAPRRSATSDTSDSRAMVRIASSCAWKVPSSAVVVARRAVGTRRVRRGCPRSTCAMSRPRRVLAEHHDAPPRVLAQDLVRAVAFLDLGDQPRAGCSPCGVWTSSSASRGRGAVARRPGAPPRRSAALPSTIWRRRRRPLDSSSSVSVSAAG